MFETKIEIELQIEQIDQKEQVWRIFKRKRDESRLKHRVISQARVTLEVYRPFQEAPNRMVASLSTPPAATL